MRTVAGRACVPADDCEWCGWDHDIIAEAAGLSWRDLPAWSVGPFLIIADEDDFIVVALRMGYSDRGYDCTRHDPMKLIGRGKATLHLEDMVREPWDYWGRCTWWPAKSPPGVLPVAK